jgi:hypothetical protein
LDGIYFYKEFGVSQFATTKDQVVPIGEPDWSNYSIHISAEDGYNPSSIRFASNPVGTTYYELSTNSKGIFIRVISEGQNKEEKVFPLEPEATLDFRDLEVRLIDRSVTLLMNQKEIGTEDFSDKAPLKGTILIPRKGIRSIEVKGIQRFYDGFGGCDGNNSGSWTANEGKWKVTTGSSEGVEDCYAQFGEGCAISLAGEEYWEGYKFRCMLRSSCRNGIGLITHYAGPNEYDLLRWASDDSNLPYKGHLQMVRFQNGKETLIKDTPMNYESDRWYDVSIIPSGKHNVVVIDGLEVISYPAVEAGLRGKIGLFCENNPGTYFDNICVDFY